MKKYFLFILLLLAIAFPLTGRASSLGLTIHSFQIAGDSSYDEFVSISNDTSSPINLSNYALSRKTKSATSWNTLYKFADGIIGPHQILIISHSKYTGVHDYVYSTSSYSLTSDNSIAIIAPDKSIVDLVGYGEASSYEGSLLPSPEAGEIFKRSEDTDNNLADFSSSTKTATIDENASKLLITELMPAPKEGKEWIELYNPTNQLVSLSGLKLCDAIGSVHCYYFLETETMKPFEYKIYSQEVTKITLNNTGDWVELRDGSDTLITDSGGDYGNADSSISLSLFGSEFMWTKNATPDAENIFLDTIEVEEPSATTPKSTSKKIKTTVATVSKTTPSVSEAGPKVAGVSMASAKVVDPIKAVVQSVKSNEILGYILIALAVALFLGYNLWERREYAREIYNKVRHRND